MNLFKNQIDHAECLKRTDHWIFVLALITFGGFLYFKDKKESENQVE